MFGLLIGLGTAIFSAASSAAATAGSVLASAGTAISTAATTVGKYVGSIASKALKVIPPEPKIPYPQRVDKVIKFIKNAAKKLSDQSNKDIESMPAYDPHDATMSELRNLQIMLNNIKKADLRDKTSVIEEIFISNVKESFDNIEKFIKDDICSHGINIDIDSLRFNFDKFIDNFSNSFSLNVDSRLSLSDYKCISILGMNNPSERSSSMNRYIDEVINEYLDKYYRDLDFITESTIDFIYRNIERVRNDNLDSINSIKKELDDNMNLDYSEIENKRKYYDNRDKIINNLFNTLK
ncbi:hypothetical protein [Brachyspira catarrhinii]|uniref:Uncharacterized protein n=1 Tax=Brachyspira catarrhinii TaxID=2528966 RepID=A0ABY2TQ62_9SPIR|nr:hypothetical protein [Brachyspira catarrhinii]TKZ34545.1 hypothetical protein EZH24_07665 [Brachyspira catarrhinii]